MCDGRRLSRCAAPPVGSPGVGFDNLVVAFDLRFHGWPLVSCCPFVLVDQSVQDPPPLDSRRRKVTGRGHGDVVAVRQSKVPAPVRAMPVVMGGVLVQDRAQVPRPGDQHPVGDLSPDGTHPPLGKAFARGTAAALSVSLFWRPSSRTLPCQAGAATAMTFGAAVAAPRFAGGNEHAAEPDGQRQHGNDGDDGQLAPGKRRVRVHDGPLANARARSMRCGLAAALANGPRPGGSPFLQPRAPVPDKVKSPPSGPIRPIRAVS
jgi:hypothetical protein